jgi:hypothetical protein
MLETFTNNISYLITGADQRRKLAYAAVFPVLLGVSYLGKFSRPRWGAGVLVVARRPVEAVPDAPVPGPGAASSKA